LKHAKGQTKGIFSQKKNFVWQALDKQVPCIIIRLWLYSCLHLVSSNNIQLQLIYDYSDFDSRCQAKMRKNEKTRKGKIFGNNNTYHSLKAVVGIIVTGQIPV